RFERQLQVFELMDVDIVGGAVTEFEGNIDNPISNRVPPHNHDEIVAFSKKRNPFNHPSVMFRKSAVTAVGGYKDFPYFEDYYLWVRMLSAGAKGYNISEPVMYMRAGNDMYARRGGRKYVKQMLNYRKTIHKMGYTTTMEYLESTVPHALVGMMPNKMRQIFYKKVLRK
ncbi:MAG: amylovoran biosynthesis protein AmsE, partial [Coprococcus sp.]